MIPTLVDDYCFNLIYQTIDRIIENNNNPRIVELGSFLGGSIERIYNYCVSKKIVPTLTAIDNWDCFNISYESKVWSGVHNNFYEAFKKNTKDMVLFSLKMDTLEASKTYEDNSIDLLFVDDGHDYPHTKNILEVWLPKVKQFGYIIGHDYSSNGVDKAVHEVFNGNVEFCKERTAYRFQKS